MEKSELDFLLHKHKLEFSWDEDSRVWWLVVKGQKTDPQKASNFEDAQDSAIQYIETRVNRPTNNYMNYPVLDALLNKHQMSFHWSDVGHNWFVIWQVKGKNTLVRSIARVATDRWEAQIAAVEFITKKYLPAL